MNSAIRKNGGAILAMIAVAFVGGLANWNVPTTSAVAVASAQSPEKSKGQEKSNYVNEDALPAGATVRLGSPRFVIDDDARYSSGDGRNVAFSPDNKYLAVIAKDSGIHIWEVATGKRILLLDQFENKARRPRTISIVYGPDSKTIAAVQDNDVVCLWDSASGKKGLSLQGAKPKSMFACTFSPDGKMLISPSKEGEIYRWEVLTGKKLDSCKGHEGGSSAVAFSCDGSAVASGGDDTDVRLWDASNGQLTAVLEGHRNRVSALSFSPDDKYLASYGRDGTVRVWDLKLRQQTHLWREKEGEGNFGMMDRPVHLAFGSDGKTLILDQTKHDNGIQSDTKKRRIYDFGRGFEKGMVALPGSETTQIQMASSPDGKLTAAIVNQRIRLVESDTGRELRRVVGHFGRVSAATFSPDGKLLATGGKDCTIRLWEVASGKELGCLEGHTGPVNHLAFTPDGRYLASANKEAYASRDNLANRETADRCVSWWDVAARKEIRQFAGPNGGIETMRLSPDGKQLTTVDPKGNCFVWDVGTGKQVVHQAGPPAYASSLSPDCKTLVFFVSGGLRQEMHVMDAVEGSEPKIFEATEQASRQVYSGQVVFDREGRTFVTGGYDYGLRLWDVAGARFSRDLYKPEPIALGEASSPNGSLAFSPDGKTIAVPVRGGRIALVEVAGGKPRQILESGQKSLQKAITVIAFSAEGDLLASGSADGTTLIWNLKAGRDTPKAKVTEAELETLWQDLFGEDALRAHRAILQLSAAPGQTLPFFKTKAPLSTAVEEKKITELIESLSNKDMKARASAEAELQSLGYPARLALAKALSAQPSFDTTNLLEKLLFCKLLPEEVRTLRVIEVVEAIASKEAQGLLQHWATGGAGTALTEEAKLALTRGARQIAN